MMPVFLASFGKDIVVGFVRIGTKHPRVLAVACHALAAKIFEMGGQGRGAAGLTHHARFDDAAARAAGDEAIGANARRPSPSKSRVARRDQMAFV
ncbi:hypothetical protein GCM10010869_58080 [Mesorhizobium tianshanense]|nr:hypothetical protein GCM10010869_58080 [Mesorhizobium tianshanense]